MSETAPDLLSVSNVVNVSVAVVAKKQNKFLLVREKLPDRKNWLWNFPSGKVRYGESIFGAVKREMMEETGVEVPLIALISSYYYITSGNSEDKKLDRTTIRFNFLANGNGIPDLLHPKENNTEAWWKTRDQLEEMMVSRHMRNWIAVKLAKEALGGIAYPLELLVDGKPLDVQ